jgi:hypothetical protein
MRTYTSLARILILRGGPTALTLLRCASASSHTLRATADDAYKSIPMPLEALPWPVNTNAVGGEPTWQVARRTKAGGGLAGAGGDESASSAGAAAAVLAASLKAYVSTRITRFPDVACIPIWLSCSVKGTRGGVEFARILHDRATNLRHQMVTRQDHADKLGRIEVHKRLGRKRAVLRIARQFAVDVPEQYAQTVCTGPHAVLDKNEGKDRCDNER